MKLLLGLFFAVLLLIGALAVGKSVWAGGTVDDVATELMCQCGCRLTLTACNMPECSVQKKMMDQVKYMLDQGQKKDEIVGYFVNTYGEEVLAAPTKTGFNWVAWLMPFAALAVGTGSVYLIVDQWVLRRGQRTAEEEVVEDEVPPAEISRYKERLRKELEEDDHQDD